MNSISKRVTSMTESQTLAMAKKSRELKEKGIDIISLSLGEPDFKTPKNIQEAAISAIQSEKYFAYTPVSGYMDVKEAICTKLKRDNNLDFAPNQIVTSTGAKQSIINVILALVNPGEEVIIPAPYWVSYVPMVELAEGVCVIIPTTVEQNYKITAEQLEASITEKSKVFLFSSPCNPTGSVYSKDELAALVKVFEKHPQIFIISDEIYEYINFNGIHDSIASFPTVKDRTIIVNGLSKGFAMTGWRFGYIAASKEIADACDKIQGQFTSATCSITQRAALEALLGDMSSVEEMRIAFARRKKIVVNGLKEIPHLKVNNPDGAFYVFPDCSAYFGMKRDNFVVEDAESFAEYLLEYCHVATVGGTGFGDKNAFRISFAASDADLIEAVRRIKEGLSKLSK